MTRGAALVLGRGLTGLAPAVAGGRLALRRRLARDASRGHLRRVAQDGSVVEEREHGGVHGE